jgi:hypothetical protein
MGQGNFTAIVWGCQCDYPMDHPIITKWYLQGIREDSLNKLTLKTSYESRDRWLGFMVADSDGNINTFYRPHEEEVYPQRGLCFYMRAIRFDRIEEEINRATHEAIPRAKAAWDQFSAEMMEAGFTLPAPYLLLVNDWS